MESQLSKGLVMDTEWKEDLEGWLEPFLIALGHKTRRRMCPAYIAGLIGPGDRKRVQPMASRASESGYDQLHHFVRSEERRVGKECVRSSRSRWSQYQ